jgi:hypothetical protein
LLLRGLRNARASRCGTIARENSLECAMLAVDGTDVALNHRIYVALID